MGTHNDAFEHLVWLHSCSGSLGVMNARRLSHLKNAGAWAALEIARQDVLADAEQHISLSTLDMAQCVSDFSDVNHVHMKVCGACGTRIIIRRARFAAMQVVFQVWRW